MLFVKNGPPPVWRVSHLAADQRSDFLFFLSMPLLQLRGVRLGYGGDLLLDGVDLALSAGDRVGLLGRNGVGKTSLLRILSGEEKPDAGEIFLQPGAVVTRLAQEVPAGNLGTVREVLHGGLAPERHEEEWEAEARLEELAQGMGLPWEAAVEELSGGWKRRVFLARALAAQPEILLLDEPTNHLDLEAILWLEEHLLSFAGAVLFITHDRSFLRHLATRVIELDRGRLTGWACDYTTFLQRKEEVLEAEETRWNAFDKKLAQEEAWLRQGVKARRTRNEGRVRALHRLRAERAQRRERVGQVRLALAEGAVSGQRVLSAECVSFAYAGGEIVVRDFSSDVWRGDKIGILGPNGCGKTTLLRVLLGELPATSGSVRMGTNLQVVYLDQMRSQLEEDRSVAENVAGAAETVRFGGRDRSIHSYLKDFLFSGERVRQPVRMLSGGERHRLLLAKLFLQPANVLVLDEPTNDLDAETLELLEDLLVSYEGTLLLVSHDREFLDHTVNSLWVFSGEGRWEEINGGYSDWVSWREAQHRKQIAAPQNSGGVTEAARRSTGGKAPKFLNRERKELEEWPERLESIEAEIATLQARIQAPELYRTPERAAEVNRLRASLADAEERLQAGFARWEELEAKRRQIEGE